MSVAVAGARFGVADSDGLGDRRLFPDGLELGWDGGRTVEHSTRPAAGVEGGAEGHGVLGMDVDGHGPADLGLDQLGHEGDAGRAPHQQHRFDLLGGHTSGVEHPTQCPDGLTDGRADHRLELGPGDADLALQAGEQHRDGGMAVAGQRLLGFDALLAQAGQGSQRGRIFGVESVEGAVERSDYEPEHRLVEVDPTQAVDALGGAEDLETARALAQDGGIEGAAAEVVDGDHLAGLHPCRAGVVDGGGFGFAQGGHLAEPREAHRLGQHVELERAPVGGMGQGDRVGRPALALGDGVDHRAQELGHERFGRVGRTTEEDGRGIPQPPLELAGHPTGLGDGTTVGGVAGEHHLVVPQEHHGGDAGGPGAQTNDLGVPVVVDGDRGVGRAEIDSEVVAHPGAFLLPLFASVAGSK